MATLVETEAGQALSDLKLCLPGLRALLVLSSGGELLDHAATSPEFNPHSFADEHATLLRIAQHTLQETGLGSLKEQILLADAASIVAVRLSPDRFAVFVCSPQVHIGRVRYEIKRGLLYSSLANL